MFVIEINSLFQTFVIGIFEFLVRGWVDSWRVPRGLCWIFGNKKGLQGLAKTFLGSNQDRSGFLFRQKLSKFFLQNYLGWQNKMCWEPLSNASTAISHGISNFRSLTAVEWVFAIGKPCTISGHRQIDITCVFNNEG